ncbi:MAG: hypothetical protein ACK47B_05975 [Armatimonadota bacterium]
MSLLLPKGAPATPPAGPRRAPLGIWVGAVLLVGGAGGWALNQALTPPLPEETLSAPVADPLADAGEDSELSLALVSTRSAGVPSGADSPAVPGIDATPPPNPFLPQGGVSAPAAQSEAGGATPQERASARVTEAKPARPVAPAAPGAAPTEGPASPPASKRLPALPEGLTLTGIIQGDPALAVLRWNEQTMFLKAGDLIADTWRLDEIRERSVTLRLSGKAGSEQRVEIPLRGGNSQ